MYVQRTSIVQSLHVYHASNKLEIMALSAPHLKNGLYETTQAPGMKLERYILENENDLQNFCAHFEVLEISIKTWAECIAEGHIVIIRDENRFGMFSFCFESEDFSHPSNFVRVKK